MIPGIILAMPEGSVWRGFSHDQNVDIGEVRVLSHRKVGMECYLDCIGQRVTMPYPANTHWKLDGDHVRVASPLTGKLTMTFAPA